MESLVVSWLALVAFSLYAVLQVPSVPLLALLFFSWLCSTRRRLCFSLDFGLNLLEMARQIFRFQLLF